MFQFAAIRRRSYQPGACFLVRELQMLVFKCLHRHILYNILGLRRGHAQADGQAKEAIRLTRQPVNQWGRAPITWAMSSRACPQNVTFPDQTEFSRYRMRAAGQVSEENPNKLAVRNLRSPGTDLGMP